jgi:hypothetical protein
MPTKDFLFSMKVKTDLNKFEQDYWWGGAGKFTASGTDKEIY